jgi:acyl dehydratase
MSLLTDELRALIATKRVYTAPEPFGAAAFRYFGMAVGDDNPLYRDAAFARAHGLPGVTAPMTLICETNQYADVGLDADGFAGHSWHLDVPGTRQVRGGNAYTFHRRVRPDDVVTATWEIHSLTEKTTRAGQDMLVVGSRATYTDQHGELLAVNDETIILVSLEGGR